MRMENADVAEVILLISVVGVWTIALMITAGAIVRDIVRDAVRNWRPPEVYTVNGCTYGLYYSSGIRNPDEALMDQIDTVRAEED